MPERSARLPLVFSCLGHTYMHFFTAFFFVIVLALEIDWNRPYHELLQLWTLGSFLVGLGALPAGWMGDRWSAAGMMVIFFLTLGAAGILCGLIDGPGALFVGLSAIGLAASIYHPVGIAWLIRHAEKPGKTLGINGIFGSIGVASAGLMAGALIDFFGWRAAFVLPGVISLATGLALLACLRAGLIPEGAIAKPAETRPGRGDMLRVFLILVVTMLAMGMIFQATQAVMPKIFDLRLRDIAGPGAFGIGAIVALVYGAGGAMQLLGGLLADRYPLKPIYVGAFLLQVPVLTGIAVFAGVPLVAAAMVSVVLSTAALPAENMLLARYTPVKHHSLAYGVKFVLAFATAPLSLLLASAIQERTGEFVWLFLLLAGLAGLALVAAALLPGEARKRPQPVLAAE